MTPIERLQLAFEDANSRQAEADEIAFAPNCSAVRGGLAAQATARVASVSAAERAYALSREILVETPETERDLLILLTHLVQQMDLINADYCTGPSLLASVHYWDTDIR